MCFVMLLFFGDCQLCQAAVFLLFGARLERTCFKNPSQSKHRKTEKQRTMHHCVTLMDEWMEILWDRPISCDRFLTEKSGEIFNREIILS